MTKNCCNSKSTKQPIKNNNLTISYKGKVYNNITSSGYLLRDLHLLGIPLNSGCLKGICGACRVICHKGTVKYHVPIVYRLKENEIITCQSKPDCDYLELS